MQKKFRNIILGLTFACLLAPFFTSCMDDDDSTWNLYKDWREFNQKWLIEQTTRTNDNGTAYYTRCNMPTDPQGYVLMHSIGEVNSQNLKPLYTSTTTVNYTLKLANDSIVDTGTNFVSQLNSSGLITGWGLCIMQLHVGDSAQFVIPYGLAYGEYGSMAVKPYSNLQFNIKLLNIDGYEVLP